jgi:serine/threonine protein kinase
MDVRPAVKPSARPKAAGARRAAKPTAGARTAAPGTRPPVGARPKAPVPKKKPAATGPAAGTKPVTRAAAAAKALAPKNAQTHSQLAEALRGTGIGDAAKRAAVEAAKKAMQEPAANGGKKGPARRSSADPLVRHGYQTQGPIAAGAFSTIVRAKSLKSGLEVAVKSFDNVKCKKDYQHLYLREGELAALRAVRLHTPSRWVANLIEEHIGPNHTYAILEYCVGGSLQRHLQKLQKKGVRGVPLAMSEVEIAHLGAQVNSALHHLHRLDVAHRDLKPGNVLFYGTDNNHLKLCDFGFAKRCRGQRLHTLCGTPIYMAPELTKESKKGYEGHPVDMWAFGAMLFEMVHNRLAFNGVSEQQLYQRIRECKVTPFRKDVCKGLKSLIMGMLTVDPSKRTSSKKAANLSFFVNANSLTTRREKVADVTEVEVEVA